MTKATKKQQKSNSNKNINDSLIVKEASKKQQKSDANKNLIESLKSFIRKNGSKYLKDENITSIGIGYKIKDNKPTNEISLQFTVGKKASLDVLESMDSTNIPKNVVVDGITVPTDVIERKYELSYKIIEGINDNKRKIKCDPIVPGISVCNINKVDAGTIGCIVFDKNDNTPYILSNWHVLHGNDGNIGDEIVQPGKWDDNRGDVNKIGELVRSHLGIAGDCAIANINVRKYEEEILGLNSKVKRICEPELNDKVVKSGRTTGVTFGKVVRLGILNSMDYKGKTGMIEISCFEIGIDESNEPKYGEISNLGDSGSAWLIAENNIATDILAGLHFAGEDSADPSEYALACYPKSVFEKLGITTSKS